MATRKKKNIEEPLLTEDIKYEPVENESVIMDKPSQPVQIVSHKESFENYKNSNENFLIYINGKEMFDSQLSSKNNINFEEDGFMLFNKKYPYTGVRIKNKK